MNKRKQLTEDGLLAEKAGVVFPKQSDDTRFREYLAQLQKYVNRETSYGMIEVDYCSRRQSFFVSISCGVDEPFTYGEPAIKVRRVSHGIPVDEMTPGDLVKAARELSDLIREDTDLIQEALSQRGKKT